MALSSDQITAKNFKDFFDQIKPFLGLVHAGFTPVGSVIAMMGVNPPANYVLCDGTVYNISIYPELANHFETEYGQSNYFGGDGTTTFAVPNIVGPSIDAFYCIAVRSIYSEKIDDGLPASNAGFHNSIYRGKYLGSVYTPEQKAAISSGTFDDLYIGDYWVIDGITYRIAAFDYWYNTGDTPCTDHHAVIVPDTCVLNNVKMNDTNIVTGAYIGSKMYTTYIAPARTTCINAFGSANILTHREYFANAVTGNPAYESSGAWYDSTVDLMNEQMVYGCKVFQNHAHGTNWSYDYTIDKSQLPLFGFRHDLIETKVTFWLRCVADSLYFSLVYSNGLVGNNSPAAAFGVRPAFGIK